MTKRNPTPPDAVLVAIDMSKHRQEVLIERPEGGRRRRMTVMATKADYDRLAAGINDLQEMSKTHEAISKAKTQTWHRMLICTES